MISDREFAGEVMKVMEEEFLPENSYRLFLSENGKLRWEELQPDGTIKVHKSDPGAPLWRRALARFLSWMPIEQEL